MIKQIILNIINSDWIQFVYKTGWILALLVSTKVGNKILSFGKQIIYCIKNPPIIYSASFSFEFKEIDSIQINKLVESMYKSDKLSKYKLSRNGQSINSYRLHYPGLDYTFDIEENDENTELLIKIKETESNYNNLNKHIKNIVIGAFIKDIVLTKILELYTTTQFSAKYQLNLKFSDTKYNFFLKERFTKIPKGYVSNALVTIKDTENKNFTIDADLKGISICVSNDIDEFIDMIGKYISIV